MIKLKSGSKVALVALSNALSLQMKEKIDELGRVLEEMGLIPICSEYLYQRESVRGATARLKARELEEFYNEESIQAVFDVSGGDIANEVLCELNFEKLIGKNKLFWGYSDLTTIINAIYTMTERPSVLYQVKKLVYEDSKEQIENFKNTVKNRAKTLNNDN